MGSRWGRSDHFLRFGCVEFLVHLSLLRTEPGCSHLERCERRSSGRDRLLLRPLQLLQDRRGQCPRRQNLRANPVLLPPRHPLRTIGPSLFSSLTCVSAKSAEVTTRLRALAIAPTARIVFGLALGAIGLAGLYWDRQYPESTPEDEQKLPISVRIVDRVK